MFSEMLRLSAPPESALWRLTFLDVSSHTQIICLIPRSQPMQVDHGSCPWLAILGKAARHVSGSDSEHDRDALHPALRSSDPALSSVSDGSFSLTHSRSWSPNTKGYLKPFSLPRVTLGDRDLLCNPVWPPPCWECWPSCPAVN